jgi:hypothetical protein
VKACRYHPHYFDIYRGSPTKWNGRFLPPNAPPSVLNLPPALPDRSRLQGGNSSCSGPPLSQPFPFGSPFNWSVCHPRHTPRGVPLLATLVGPAITCTPPPVCSHPRATLPPPWAVRPPTPHPAIPPTPPPAPTGNLAPPPKPRPGPSSGRDETPGGSCPGTGGLGICPRTGVAQGSRGLCKDSPSLATPAWPDP